MSESESPARTALYDLHIEAGAKMVEFGGWLMPVQYRGILGEHRRVREGVGVFDVSHMGRLIVRGRDAGAFLQTVATNDVLSLGAGQVQYTLLCNPAGGVKDDTLISRLGAEEYLLVPNAANRLKVLQWFHEVTQGHWGGRGAFEIVDRTLETVMVAVQGPEAVEALQPHTDVWLDRLGRYRIAQGQVMGAEGLISRTGYTGEDGFEVVVPTAAGVELWRQLMKRYTSGALAMAGLGARDTLRLEAGLPLYGNELDETINPLEVGLGRFVKLDKPLFIGREALTNVSEAGPKMRLVGLEVEDGAIARHGTVVQWRGRVVGHVTSGSYSPTLDRSIAMALISVEAATAKSPLGVIVRGNTHLSRVVNLPFYRRRKEK